LLGEKKWPHLWEPVPFFSMYKHYLQVTIVALNADDFKKWEGWVHSRLRMLVQGVETCSGGALAAHPYPEKKLDPSRDEETHCVYYLGLGPAAPVPGQNTPAKGTLNLNGAVQQFQMLVTNWVNRADGSVVWQPGMEAHVKHMKRKDLPARLVAEAAEAARRGEEAEGVPPNDPEAAAAAAERARVAAAAAGGGDKKRAREDGEGDGGAEGEGDGGDDAGHAPSSKKPREGATSAEAEGVEGDEPLKPPREGAQDDDGDGQTQTTQTQAHAPDSSAIEVTVTDGAPAEALGDGAVAADVREADDGGDDLDAGLAPDDDIAGLNDDDGDVAGLAPDETAGLPKSGSNPGLKVSFASAVRK
jgi:poly(A) polymerase